MEAAGLRVVAVGLGQPKHARQFGDRLAPSVDCETREEPELHAGYGIGRANMLRLLAPDAIKAGIDAAGRGHTQGQTTGDAQRLPATFIIDADGIVRYAYYGKFAGDNPDLAEVIRQWREANETDSIPSVYQDIVA